MDNNASSFRSRSNTRTQQRLPDNTIRLNIERAPLCIIELYGIAPEATFRKYLVEYDAFVRSQKKYAAIFDLTHAGRTPDHQRRDLVAWMKKNKPLIRERCVGLGLVVPTVLARMVTRSVMMLAPTPAPHFVSKHRSEVEHFCTENLRSAGFFIRTPTTIGPRR